MLMENPGLEYSPAKVSLSSKAYVGKHFTPFRHSLDSSQAVGAKLNAKKRPSIAALRRI
jgi:hypothetical protein